MVAAHSWVKIELFGEKKNPVSASNYSNALNMSNYRDISKSLFRESCSRGEVGAEGEDREQQHQPLRLQQPDIPYPWAR